MFRVDDNTYIDTTLITCAEYQLFIDEMSAQGRYYQPDHWISNQFPAGQANMPILGVRFSDALDFCKWLTQRTNTVWSYRIPTQNEAVGFTIPSSKNSHFGYWIQPSPTSPVTIWFSGETRQELTFTLDIERDQSIVTTLAFDSGKDLVSALDFSGDQSRIYAFVRMLALTREGDSYLTKAIEQMFVRDLSQDHKPTVDFDRALRGALNRVRNRVGDIARSNMNELKVSRIHDIDLVYSIDLNSDLNLVNELVVARDRCLRRALSYKHKQNDLFQMQEEDVDLILSGFIDVALNILLLRQRKSGSYPAFESIRVAKERIAE